MSFRTLMSVQPPCGQTLLEPVVFSTLCPAIKKPKKCPFIPSDKRQITGIFSTYNRQPIKTTPTNLPCGIINIQQGNPLNQITDHQQTTNISMQIH